MPSLQDLIELFQRETGFERLFSLFREKYRSYERIGQNVKVVLNSPTPQERQALEGFFGESLKGTASITISVAKFQKAINMTIFKESFSGYGINDVVLMYYNGQLISKKQEIENFQQEKEQFFQSVIEGIEPESPFYRFLVFIREHSSAARVHAMYKSNSYRLCQLFELVENLFSRLPLYEDVFLPMLAYELTGDSHALNPDTDGGRMILFALQVIDHIELGIEISEKLTDDQMQDVLKRHNILFCPDTQGELKRKLLILDEGEGLERETPREELIALKKIGAGYFAKVFSVHDTERKKEMACKVLSDRNYFGKIYGKEGDEHLKRFKREVRILQKELNHPNVISIDRVQLHKSPFWFSMPLADSSLESWLENNQDATEETRLYLFKQILTGMKYLHDRGINHRDLAPNNILIFKSSIGHLQAKIADFGLVKDHQSLSILTRHSVNGYGRGGFTAPEQLRSLNESDHLSDIYALGALLYNVLSGQLPERRFVSPTKYQYIVAKAMEDNRSKRYQTISEFMKDLTDATERSLSNGEISFCNLIDYQYNDIFNDVLYTLKCISEARIEHLDEVYERFVKPLLSIPTEVLAMCCEYGAVMILFVEIISRNLANLYGQASTLTLKEWDQILLLLELLFHNVQIGELKISILKIVLKCAFTLDISFARFLIGRIIESLPSDGGIAEEVAHILEMEFASYNESLIQILEGKDYPTPIRFALNDF